MKEAPVVSPVVLIVDDDRRNVLLLESMLRSAGYRCATAQDGAEALARAAADPPDVVLLDIMMPGQDGFEVAQELRRREETARTPIVMVTALTDVADRVRALEVGADDFLSKPLDRLEVLARVRTLVTVKAWNDRERDRRDRLEREVAARTADLQAAYARLRDASLETVLRLAAAAEFKDEDTGAHLARMSHVAAAVARRLGLPPDEVDDLLRAAPMHDIGKIGVPDQILLKRGPLDPDEWRIMREHPLLGARILGGSDSPLIRLAETIAVSHHERWDGTGYPHGLKGEEIPLVGRIVAIADVFDALTSRRPYKEPFPVEKAQAIVREGRGTHFDPAVVDAFIAVFDEVLAIRDRFRDETPSPLAAWSGGVGAAAGTATRHAGAAGGERT